MKLNDLERAAEQLDHALADARLRQAERNAIDHFAASMLAALVEAKERLWAEQGKVGPLPRRRVRTAGADREPIDHAADKAPLSDARRLRPSLLYPLACRLWRAAAEGVRSGPASRCCIRARRSERDFEENYHAWSAP